MIPARALCLLAALPAVLPLPAAALGPLDVDGGLRAAIYDDNYDLGVGGTLGLVQNIGAKSDLGLHLNYTRFTAKTVGWTDINEFGAYVTAYFVPTLTNQPFEMRLGPHVGASVIDESWHADLGGDVSVVFLASPSTRFYANFAPAYVLGENSGGLIRIGLGLQFRLSGGAATYTPGPAGQEPGGEPAP